jgi:hypothetical protein
MGQNVQILPVANTTCPGEITQSQTHSDEQGQFQSVLGWIDHPIATNTEPEIVFVDRSGKIIGFGSVTASRNGPFDWAGYARSENAPAAAYFFASGALYPLTNNR